MKYKTILIAALITAPLFMNAKDSIPDKIKQQNINVVKAAAEGLNEKLPQKVDKYTSLIKLEAKGEKLIYIYEINDPKMSDEEIAQKGVKKMKKPVIHGICTSSKRFLDSGITISYVYTGAKSKKALFHFDVKKEDCKQ